MNRSGRFLFFCRLLNVDNTAGKLAPFYAKRSVLSQSQLAATLRSDIRFQPNISVVADIDDGLPRFDLAFRRDFRPVDCAADGSRHFGRRSFLPCHRERRFSLPNLPLRFGDSLRAGRLRNTFIRHTALCGGFRRLVICRRFVAFPRAHGAYRVKIFQLRQPFGSLLDSRRRRSTAVNRLRNGNTRAQFIEITFGERQILFQLSNLFWRYSHSDAGDNLSCFDRLAVFRQKLGYRA